MQCMQWCPKPSYDQNQGLRGRQDSEILQLYGQIQSKTHPKNMDKHTAQSQLTE
jgi:hypothetical protein